MGTISHDQWFKTFVARYPGAEIVEEVVKATGMPNDFRNADFFFNNRRFVGELKTLETTRIAKVQTHIDRLRESGELPIYYHPAPVDEVIKQHPERRTLNLTFLKEITRTLRKDFATANRQIGETKDQFRLGSSYGFIVITNVSLAELTPQIAWSQLNHLILKKEGAGNYAYPNIDFALYIQNIEVVELDENNALTPTLILLRQENPEISKFTGEFLSAFASATGYGFVESKIDGNTVLNRTIRHKRFNTQNSHNQLTRSEFWRQRYMKERTYSGLSDGELVSELAWFLLEEFLVVTGGKIGPSTDAAKRDFLGEKLEHLFTEYEIRYIDMRCLGKRMDEMLERGLVEGPVPGFLRAKKSSVTL